MKIKRVLSVSFGLFFLLAAFQNCGGTSGFSTLDSASMNPTFSDQSAQYHPCGPSLAPGESCTVSVKFVPSDRGVRSGEVTIISNASKNPEVISLSGTGN